MPGRYPVQGQSVPGTRLGMYPVQGWSVPGASRGCTRYVQGAYPVRTKSVPAYPADAHRGREHPRPKRGNMRTPLPVTERREKRRRQLGEKGGRESPEGSGTQGIASPSAGAKKPRMRPAAARALLFPTSGLRTPLILRGTVNRYSPSPKLIYINPGLRGKRRARTRHVARPKPCMQASRKAWLARPRESDTPITKTPPVPVVPRREKAHASITK